MTARTSPICRRAPCPNPVPPTLVTAQLCLNHFLDEAFVRTNHALETSEARRPLDPAGVQSLLSDALAVVENLEEGASDPDPEQRERMLELLLILANLHEYAAHPQPIRINRLA